MVRYSLLALAAVASALPLDPRQSVTCVSGLYILVARGSNQAAGEGTVGPVADAIEALVPGSVSQAIDYPATIISGDSNYITSVIQGINDTKTKIQNYVAACGASSKIALVGFSQGANVMGDVLAGGTGKPAPLAEQYRKNIKAAVLFGDPRFRLGQSYDVGTANNDGLFARDDSLALFNTYASVIQSYCDNGDPFCERGLDLSVHSATPGKYTQAAAKFVASRA